MQSLVYLVFGEMAKRSAFEPLLAELLDNLFLTAPELLKGWTLDYANYFFLTIINSESWRFVSVHFVNVDLILTK